jgi:hypothetical protein
MTRCGAKVVSGSFDADLPEPVYRETIDYPGSKSRLHSQRSSCFFDQDRSPLSALKPSRPLPNHQAPPAQKPRPERRANSGPKSRRSYFRLMETLLVYQSETSATSPNVSQTWMLERHVRPCSSHHIAVLAIESGPISIAEVSYSTASRCVVSFCGRGQAGTGAGIGRDDPSPCLHDLW